MATTSKASATWEGVLRSGKGHFEAGSGAFKGDYSFATRFEGAKGTNPEELLAASHAACFSMALSVGLELAGTPATRITTTAHCTVDKVGNGFKVTTMRLDVRGRRSRRQRRGVPVGGRGGESGVPDLGGDCRECECEYGSKAAAVDGGRRLSVIGYRSSVTHRGRSDCRARVPAQHERTDSR